MKARIRHPLGVTPGATPKFNDPYTYERLQKYGPKVTPSMVKAYCVKCKTKREMKDAKQVRMKNGKPAMKGKCPVCGSGMYLIGVAK